METLYDRIKQQCERKGVAVSRMCLDLGMPKSMMSDLKKGRKHSLSVETLKKISNYFGVPVSFFLEEELPPEDEFATELQLLRDNPETRSLLKAVKGMSPEQVRKMRDLILSMKGD